MLYGSVNVIHVLPLRAESVRPDSPERQEVAVFCTASVLPVRDVLWVCPAPRVRLISVEEKPHVTYQHYQTDTTHKAAVCGGVHVKKERQSSIHIHFGKCEPG